MKNNFTHDRMCTCVLSCIRVGWVEILNEHFEDETFDVCVCVCATVVHTCQLPCTMSVYDLYQYARRGLRRGTGPP